MRLLVVTVGTTERDAVLEPFPPTRLARLIPYVETRVAESGAGTLVVIPSGHGVAAAAAATAVALNRITPDAVVVAELAEVAGLAEPGIGGDPVVLDRLRAQLPDAAEIDPVGDLYEGALVAAAVHRVPLGRLTGVHEADLAAACRRAFGAEWPAISRAATA